MASAIGVLLAQVGTPAAPTAAAVRPYLRKFLSDDRIVDYPKWLWQPILNTILLTRPARSAKHYAEIWTQEGSPLMTHSLAQQQGLQALLGEQYRVELGLAYTQGMEVADGMARLRQAGCQRILLLPLFPQYSSTTTAAAYDAAFCAALGRPIGWGKANKHQAPTLRVVEPFYKNPSYLCALSANLKKSLAALPKPADFHLISFHGIPTRYEREGDPYRGYCQASAQLIAQAMGWSDGQWGVAFQSQFGPEKWLEPSTQKLLPTLAAKGVKRLAILAPGFTTDCVETLEELACEGKELWHAGGGKAENFHYLPCLNASAEFLKTLHTLVIENTAGWNL